MLVDVDVGKSVEMWKTCMQYNFNGTFVILFTMIEGFVFAKVGKGRLSSQVERF